MIINRLNINDVKKHPDAKGGSDPETATDITLSSASGTMATGDLGSTVGFGLPGAAPNGSFSISPFTPAANVIPIGDWQLDLSSLATIDQTAGKLTLEWNGVLSHNGFQGTVADWTFSPKPHPPIR